MTAAAWLRRRFWGLAVGAGITLLTALTYLAGWLTPLERSFLDYNFRHFNRIAADPTALVRFEREAKAIAALSHPIILAICDVGMEHGASFVGTEYPRRNRVVNTAQQKPHASSLDDCGVARRRETFRRIRGCRLMPRLLTALDSESNEIAE